ncbi:SLIT and NTRK-like protein 5 [Neodiprion pinetum]|uniref:SLIT and NTRK-like protein 5 n=1 Tax=Neodiprion pinetum TaxID=441929 RepID=UPI00076FACE3|nr:uncharacterized protein LOC124217885 [Neodiprion pinetum]
MKLQGTVNAVFILGVAAGLTEIASGVCIVRNTPETKVYRYQCFRSNNYLADLTAAPIDVPKISFTNARIQYLRNKSFARFGPGLKSVQINYSELGEIEDSPFEGLVELRSLLITGCNLQIVKGTWFEGLSKLDTIILDHNEIKSVESSFFKIVQPLKSLDLSFNQISCIPVASIYGFRTQSFHLEGNHLAWACLAQLLDWFKKNNIKHDFAAIGPFPPMEPLINMCVERHPSYKLDETGLEKCIRKKLMDFFPPGDNYTVEQACRFLTDKPSPFLNCFDI